MNLVTNRVTILAAALCSTFHVRDLLGEQAACHQARAANEGRRWCVLGWASDGVQTW